MQTVYTTISLKEILQAVDKTIGFVPTMGALHNGHISLIQQSKKYNDITVVSIFVNPTQFLENEDIDKYPRTLKQDIEICKLNKVDILFVPNINDMYSHDSTTIKAPNTKSYILEGLNRPSHFDGVLLIVLKLFNIIKPNNAYFGKKDTQQLILIKQMIQDLFMDINIVGCETIREDTGLAMSSRNTYLSNAQKKIASNIYKSLKIAYSLIKKNCTNSKKIEKQIENNLTNMDIEYIHIVNRDLKEIANIELNNTIILISVKLGKTRLIDNIWI